MAHTHTELYYHFAWATKGRAPAIDAEAEPHLFRYLRHKCEALRICVHALDGDVDHVHLACMLPPTLSVADCMEKLKGSSSHFMNHRPGATVPFAWQPGYCALTFAKRDLRRVVAYICNQKQHHATGTLWPKAEQWEEVPDAPCAQGFSPGRHVITPVNGARGGGSESKVSPLQRGSCDVAQGFSPGP